MLFSIGFMKVTWMIWKIHQLFQNCQSSRPKLVSLVNIRDPVKFSVARLCRWSRLVLRKVLNQIQVHFISIIGINAELAACYFKLARLLLSCIPHIIWQIFICTQEVFTFTFYLSYLLKFFKLWNEVRNLVKDSSIIFNIKTER